MYSIWIGIKSINQNDRGREVAGSSRVCVCVFFLLPLAGLFPPFFHTISHYPPLCSYNGYPSPISPRTLNKPLMLGKQKNTSALGNKP